MDEFSLLSLIQSTFKTNSSDIIKGIGDDTAVIKSGNTYLLLTTDSLVENIHFRKDWGTPADRGKKAMAMNISDIAAMGGTPLYALIAWNKGTMDETESQEIINGINEIATTYKIDIIGGNISSSGEFSLNITLIGKSDKPVYRSGAENGDLIVTTGSIGDASLGLYLLENNFKGLQHSDKPVQKQLNPEPRITEGNIIKDYASSMIDISDGLLLDLNRLLDSSNKGAIIYPEKIPRSKEFIELSKRLSIPDEIKWGGEDYELLFTISEENFNRLKTAYKSSVPLTVIGKINNTDGKILTKKDGKLIPVSPRGWIH